MQQTIVKTYEGRQQKAIEDYQADAAKMALKGYLPTSQVWAPGSYGFGSFIFALLLCIIFVGILIFIYMLIVKPAGTLTVTYTLAPRADPEKVCPKCAERVKVQAEICRFCGHTFHNVVPARLNETAVKKIATELSGAEKFGRKLGVLFAKKPSHKQKL